MGPSTIGDSTGYALTFVAMRRDRILMTDSMSKHTFGD
jgi:hypothetical protein